MDFQLVSDLHLEQEYVKLPGGELLIMAGDIMVADHLLPRLKSDNSGEIYYRVQRELYERFANVELSKYDRVLYIPGNHEYYHSPMETAIEELRKIMPAHVQIVNNDTVEIDDAMFICSTMWTDMNKSDWFTINHAKKCMADFSFIRYNDRFLSPEATINFFDQATDYIKIVAKQNADKKIVVVTHHCPSELSVAEQYKGDLLNGAFRSDCDNIILDHPQIKMWLHGHTHTEFDYMLGDCRVVCNPRGYYNSHHEHAQAFRYAPAFLSI